MSKFEDGSYQCLPGPALIAKILAGRCQMHYTRAAVGKGTLPEGVSPKELSEPPEYVMDAMIAEVSNPVDGECQVTVQINSSDVEVGFYANYIILYAEDPDDGEVPYTCLKMEDGLEWIRPKSSAVGKLSTFDLIAAVGDVDIVSATIDPNAIVSVAQMERMIAEHDKDPDAHSAAISDAVAAAIKEELDGNTQTGEGAPGAEIPGVPGQHYFDTVSGTEYVCTGTAEDGTYIWEVSGAGAVEEHNKDPNAHAEIIEEAVDAAFQRLVEEGTVIDKAEVERLIKSATNGTGGVFSGLLALTMPADGWALADTPKGKYIYFCDVAAEGVTADHWPTGGVNLEDEDAAQVAGVGGGCDTFDGYIRFYSKAIPEQDIRATIVLFVQGQGSTGSGDTITQDMLGDGLTVTDDGKLTVAVGNGLSVDEDGRLSVDISTDAEAGSAIDGVFDGNA